MGGGSAAGGERGRAERARPVIDDRDAVVTAGVVRHGRALFRVVHGRLRRAHRRVRAAQHGRARAVEARADEAAGGDRRRDR